jgi:hypothetical protein
VADNLQSTFSPTGECTKLADNAFTFCSLETLWKKKCKMQLERKNQPLVTATLVAATALLQIKSE